MLLTHRKFWKNQITDPNELKIGMRVTKVYDFGEKGCKEHYVIYGKGSCELGRYFLYKKDGMIEHCFYSDSNVMPYKNGRWNPTNYLVAGHV